MITNIIENSILKNLEQVDMSKLLQLYYSGLAKFSCWIIKSSWFLNFCLSGGDGIQQIHLLNLYENLSTRAYFLQVFMNAYFDLKFLKWIMAYLGENSCETWDSSSSMFSNYYYKSTKSPLSFDVCFIIYFSFSTFSIA